LVSISTTWHLDLYKKKTTWHLGTGQHGIASLRRIEHTVAKSPQPQANNNEKERKVAWSKLCVPKKEGGDVGIFLKSCLWDNISRKDCRPPLLFYQILLHIF